MMSCGNVHRDCMYCIKSAGLHRMQTDWMGNVTPFSTSKFKHRFIGLSLKNYSDVLPLRLTVHPEIFARWAEAKIIVS
jgi:hypothetical protein